MYFENGFDELTLSHNPIVIRKNTQGAGETTSGNPGEICCDQIQIVYEDFNQNHFNENEQPFKRYRITYFAQQTNPTTETYGVFKRIESYSQPRTGCFFSDPAEPSTTKGTWINTCNWNVHQKMLLLEIT